MSAGFVRYSPGVEPDRGRDFESSVFIVNADVARDGAIYRDNPYDGETAERAAFAVPLVGITNTDALIEQVLQPLKGLIGNCKQQPRAA